MRHPETLAKDRGATEGTVVHILFRVNVAWPVRRGIRVRVLDECLHIDAMSDHEVGCFLLNTTFVILP